jgi:hypothetical protein
MPQEMTNNALTLSNQEALEKSLEYNKYTFGDGVDPYLQFEPIHRYNDSDGSYKDYINRLKAETDDMDMAGTILNGQGIGWDGTNLVSSFDVRNTIAGRALTATGVINDTPMGQIGNKALRDILINRTLFNTQSETVGRINIDPVNAIKGGDIIRPDYSITIGYDFLGKVAETFTDLTGIQTPIDQLDDDSSIWERGNSQNMIKNTGKGQVKALFTNLSENKWGPGYEDKRIKKISLKKQLTYDDLRNELSGFTGLVNNEVNYKDINAPEDSLLGKTKTILTDDKLGKDYKLMHDQTEIMVEPSETTSTVQKGGQHFMSRGSGVKAKDGDKVFARVFTKDNPYKKVKNLQKSRGLAYKNSADKSVLDSNGFVRISPYSNDGITSDTNAPRDTNMKKFMFSIENLAWDGYTNDLPASEVGPGDKVNGSRGRIMWFPPYDMTFNDTTSVNIESTNFIGRGEPVYTYNNTERTGNLQFKIIIDYPSYMEDFKGETEEFFQRVASGVEDINYSNLSANDRDQIESVNALRMQPIMDIPEIAPSPFTVYFNHTESDVDTTTPDNEKITEDFMSSLLDKLDNQCPHCSVQLKVGATDAEKNYPNLVGDRIVSIKSWLEGQGLGRSIEVVSEDLSERAAVIKFKYDPTNNPNNLNQIKPLDTSGQVRTLNTSAKKKFMNESLYFKKLHEESPIAYESLNSKIEHFHPGFHSITPEGFNSRLTFLQQCTRQGPTQNKDRASNLAFGKPPVSILRIGDFYHTKIMMESLSFNYEPLVWDLNPEGVGVQPMICTVDISFKFIGGSSLDGPINKLQNAISHNFFANTEVYDGRADRIENGEIKDGYVMGPDSVDSEEVDSGEVKVDTPPVDEIKRVEKEIKVAEVKEVPTDLMSNLNLGITALTSKNIRFTLGLYIDGAYPEEKLEPTTFKCYLQVVSSYAEDNLMFDGLKRVQIPSHTLTVDNQFVEVVAELSEEQLNHINKGNKIVLTLKKDNLPLIAEYTI